jgi:hypothetical protein
MPYFVTGSPVEAFADAIIAALRADADATRAGTLAQLFGSADQLATRIVASLKTGERTVYPYLTVGRRRLAEGSGGAAMGMDGGRLELWIEFWSDKNGPHEVQALQGRVRALLPRDRVLALTGYQLHGGSLVCEDEVVEPDFDDDMPQRSLFRGEQKWAALVEAA